MDSEPNFRNKTSLGATHGGVTGSMSESDRGKRSPYLRNDFAVIAILAAYIVVGVLAFYSGRQNERRTYEPHQHAISAADAAQERCVGREPPAMAECIVEQVAAAEETSRGEQDLEAQQNMALWALLMVLVSTATVGVTVWALVYIKDTLDETRKMAVDTGHMANEAKKATEAAVAAAEAGRESNKIAREVSERQVRAYVSVRPTRASLMPSVLEAEFEVTNSGQSPARSVQLVINCDARDTDKAFISGSSVHPIGDLSSGSQIPLTAKFSIGPELRALLVEKVVKFDLKVGLTYTTVFESTTTETIEYTVRAGGGKSATIRPPMRRETGVGLRTGQGIHN